MGRLTQSQYSSMSLFPSNCLYSVSLASFSDIALIKGSISIVLPGIASPPWVGFCVNELLSIVENAGLMGLPLPPAIKKALEVLRTKAEFEEE